MKKEINRWIKHYQQKLNLQEWKISVIYKRKDDSENPAYIRATEQYRKADLIWIEENRNSKQSIRTVVKHELLHLVHAEYDKLLKDVLDNFSDDLYEAGSVYWNQSRNIAERLVTKLEKLIK